MTVSLREFVNEHVAIERDSRISILWSCKDEKIHEFDLR